MPLITTGTVIEQNDVQFYTVRINNNLLGPGYSTGAAQNYGYGQATLNSNAPIGYPVVKADTLMVTAGAVEKLLRHQGVTNFASIITSAGQVIKAEPSLATNYQLAIENRLNAYAAGIPSYAAAFSTESFNSTQLITATCSFGSHNKARFFFNAGGQFNIRITHPTGTGAFSANMTRVAEDLGNIRFGAGSQRIGTTNYTGTTILGGINNNYSVVQSDKSFYNLIPGGILGDGYSTPDVILAVQGEFETTAAIYVYAKYDGAGTVTFRIASYAPGTNPTTPAGTVAYFAAIQPPTTYIQDSWSPFTWATNVVQTSVATEAPQSSIMGPWLNERGNYIRGGLFQTYYAGDYAVWNDPHIRRRNQDDNFGVYTEVFTYDTSGTVAAATMESMSNYYTALTYVTGGIGSYRVPPTTLPINRNTGAIQYPITSFGEVYTQDGSQYPDASGYFGLGFNVQSFAGKLSSISSTLVTTYQGGGNNGSWNYQLLIPGKWGVARRDAEFTGYRTLPPGGLAVVLYERGGNGNGSQLPVAPFTIRYDAWWYNGGGMQICANNTGSPQTIDLTLFNTGYSPRLYIELFHPS